MSSFSLPPAVALYVAQIEQQCEQFEPPAKLDFIEKKIRETCDDVESHYLQLDALVEFVTARKLYRLRYSSDRAWRKSLDPSIREAIDHSRSHRGMCEDLAMKIHRSWNVWPWQLVGSEHQPRCWSKGILEGLYKMSRWGCGRSVAETFLAQARVDRAGRDYSDRRLGVTRDDILTKADVTAALKNYEQSTVEGTHKKRKEPPTAKPTRPKTRKMTHVALPSGNDVTSPENEVGRTHSRSLTNDESSDVLLNALLSPSSGSACPYEGSLLSSEPLGHAEETLASKADHRDKSSISSLEAKHPTDDDGDSEPGSIYQDDNTGARDAGLRDRHSVSVHPQSRVVPDNDVSGAVSTLGERQWVSSTAVELALEKLHCAGVRMFDSSFLAGDGSTFGLKEIGDEKLWILPLSLHGNHWGLITIEIDSGNVEFWNSLSLGTEAYESEARRIVNLFGQAVHTSRAIVYPSASDEAALRNREWEFNVRKCPQQENTDDCGVYAIVFAVYKVCGFTLPGSIDVGLWRHLLKQLIQSGSVVIEDDQPAGTVPALEPATNDVVPASPKTTARQTPQPQAMMHPQDPLARFKRLEKRLSTDLVDAREQLRLSADTLRCLEQVQKQVAAFRDQKVQKEREILEAIRIHQDMISLYSRLGASRSRNLDALLNRQLWDCEKRCEGTRHKMNKLSDAVGRWKLAVQTCSAVCKRRHDLMDSRTEALRTFLDEIRSWSERQKVLINDVKALEVDVAATIEV